MKDQVLAKIRLHSKDNPIYSIQIEKELDISGIKVREIIRDLRREGKPIANSTNGYFYAKNADEYADTIKDLENRSYSMLQTLKAMRSAFEVKELTLF